MWLMPTSSYSQLLLPTRSYFRCVATLSDSSYFQSSRIEERRRSIGDQRLDDVVFLRFHHMERAFDLRERKSMSRHRRRIDAPVLEQPQQPRQPLASARA